MKLLLTLGTAIALCISCNNQPITKHESIDEIEVNDPDFEIKKVKNIIAEENQSESIIGSYEGFIGESGDAKKMRLLISGIENNIIEGCTIVDGINRSFSQTLHTRGDVCLINVKEPADDFNAGEYIIKINRKNPSELEGKWIAYDKNIEKKYTLKKRAFTYDPTAGQYDYTSTRLLNSEDVENLSKYDLFYMRNEIFARHGYCFKKKETREMFEFYDWYVPCRVDINKVLSRNEKKNIVLITRYEKYAEEYGRDFGR